MHRYSSVGSLAVLVVAAVVFPLAWAATGAGLVLLLTRPADDRHAAAALLSPMVALLAGAAWRQAATRRWPRRRGALVLAALFGVGSTAGAWWAASRDWVPPYGRVPPGWGVTDWIGFYDQWWLFAVPLPALVAIVLLVRHYAGRPEAERRALWARASVVRAHYTGDDTENPRACYDLEYDDRTGDVQRTSSSKRPKATWPATGDALIVWYDPLHPAAVVAVQEIPTTKRRR